MFYPFFSRVLRLLTLMIITLLAGSLYAKIRIHIDHVNIEITPPHPPPPPVIIKKIGEIEKHDEEVLDHVSSEAAAAAKRDAVRLRIDSAHVLLMAAEQARKRTQPMTEQVLAARDYTGRMADDIRDGRFGHATQDLTKSVAFAIAAWSESSQEASSFSSTAREALRANLDAIQAARAGRWGHSAEAMGQSLRSAGSLVASAGEPEVGSAMTSLGSAIEDQAPYAEQAVHDLKQGNVNSAAHDAVNDYLGPKRAALALGKVAVQDAKAGKFGEASLVASLAVALVSGTATNSLQFAATDTAIEHAQAALDDVKGHQYGKAGEDVGDAVSSAGQALSASGDAEDGQSLIDAGTQIHQYASSGQEDVQDAKGFM